MKPSSTSLFCISFTRMPVSPRFRVMNSSQAGALLLYRAFRVLIPATPSCFSPAAFWNRITASLVRLPKSPSMGSAR